MEGKGVLTFVLTVCCAPSSFFVSPFSLDAWELLRGEVPTCRVHCKEVACVYWCPISLSVTFYSAVGDHMASGVHLSRFKLGLQLCDLEKAICPFCASAFYLTTE